MEPSSATPPAEPSLAAELRSTALLFGLVVVTTAAVALGAQQLVEVFS